MILLLAVIIIAVVAIIAVFVLLCLWVASKFTSMSVIVAVVLLIQQWLWC